MRGRVLVIDDKENMRKLFEKILGEHFDVTTAADGTQGLMMLGLHPFDVVVSDIRMPGADGFQVLKATREVSPETEVILMTAYASVEKAVEAIKEGAFDYLQKPFEPDDVTRLVTHAVERKRLRAQALHLRKEIDGLVGVDGLIGKSPSMRAVFTQIDQAAGVDITVLLTGESGTGKELVARAIHGRGPRKDHLFIPVNCGALPSELIESELFGHVRGAFTGATTSRRGLFEEAHQGTLFLDEIGDLPLPAQVKLTRVLQEREVRRVGDTRATKVDVRVIAATLKDLKAEVQAGRFREDLYYRLHVFPLHLPPLRARPEDIPQLAAHFLERYTRLARREIEGMEPAALAALTRYAWPGNVRELENTLERAVAVCTGPRIDVHHLPAELRAEPSGAYPPAALVQLPYREAVELARDQISQGYLVALMREFQGNVTRAAERAGLERESLHRLLKRYGVRPQDYK